MTLFEELGVEYKEVDGILYPLLSVDEAEYNLTDIGKYGRMWLRYMIENKPSEYRHMARMGQLRKQAEAVNEEAYERLDNIEAWLMSAEYIMSGGNENVILCERGIRTFETATRNTFDVSAIPVLHNLTHLPVIADPSHASGKSSLIKPLAKSAVAAGADGLMIEVHPEPSKALCDGAQSLTPDAFDDVMTDVKKLCEFENKTL